MNHQGPPPAGGDRNRGPALLTATWTFTALALLLVAFRMLTRFKLIHSPGLDDLFIFVSVLLSTTNTAFFTAAVNTGLGRHAYYLSHQQQSEAVRLISIANPFGLLAFAVPKISVALFLMRIMAPTKWRAWFLYFLSISVTIFTIVCDILLFVQCSPPKSLWNPTIPHKCWPTSVLTNFTIFVGSYSAFADFYLAFFPTTFLWKLQMKKGTKIGLCGVMSLGALAGICAIIKTTQLPALAEHPDYTWYIYDLSLWTSVEGNIIIIAACLPTLRPFVRVVLGKPASTAPKYTPYPKRSMHTNFFQADQVALHPISQDGKNTTRRIANDDSRVHAASDTNVLPADSVGRTTELRTEWELV